MASRLPIPDPSSLLGLRMSGLRVMGPQPQAMPARAVDLQERRILRFTAAILIAAIFLQRFALPFPGKSISIVGPIGIAAAAVGLLSGALAISCPRLIAFLALSGWAIVGTAWQETRVSSFGTPPDLNSLSQYLALTSFAVVSFARPIDEGRLFRQVNFYLTVIAVAGLLQFAAQFVGVRIFEFTGLLPSSLLFESGYNVVIPTGFAGLFNANGFFLVEPSVFSQFMAVALIIEMLHFRRVRNLLLFATGLILSFSGTGWIVLGAFVLSAMISLGGRGLALAAAMLLVLGLAIGAAVLLAPDVAAIFSERFAEFSQPGTSANMRFITPVWLVHDVLARVPSALLIGIGSGASEHLQMPYAFDVNTPVKIMLEYGLPALIAYIALFIAGPKTPLQGALVFPGLVLFFFTGGYQQFPPVLFLILLLLSVAWLRPATTPAVGAVPLPVLYLRRQATLELGP